MALEEVDISVCIPIYKPNLLWFEQLIKSLQKSIEIIKDNLSFEVLFVDDSSPCNKQYQLIISEHLIIPYTIYQNDENMGLAGAWNTCVNYAKGNWVHILHQDDLIDLNFYKKMIVDRHESSAGMKFCQTNFINEYGKIDSQTALVKSVSGLVENPLQVFLRTQPVQCPSVLVKKMVYQELGGFDTDLIYTLDWFYWIKVATNYKVEFISEALASYRISTTNETNRLKSKGEDAKDSLLALKKIKLWLKANSIDERQIRMAEIRILNFNLYKIKRMLQKGEILAACMQFRYSLVLIRNISDLKNLIKSLVMK
ncbi:glycosyltransferase [bacterium]|nr:MAG: glycosyltransferase [bacterium]